MPSVGSSAADASNPTSPTSCSTHSFERSNTVVAKRQKPSTTFHLLAGLAAGSASAVLLQPADLLKTRVQQSASHSLSGTIRSIFMSPQPIRQLWRGALPSTIRTSIGSALYFTTLNHLRSRVAKSQAFTVATSKSINGTVSTSQSKSSSALPKLTPLANLSCGAFARASVGFVMMPITVIKVRYESNFYEYRSILDAVRGIGSTDGLRGFFAGFGATAMRDAPYAGLYVLFYEKGKTVLSRFASSLAGKEPGGLQSGIQRILPISEARPDLQAFASQGRTLKVDGPPSAHLTPAVSAGVNFASSTVAASAATLLTNPPDAIKTRLQVQPKKYKNSFQALKLMLKEEGTRSLFDGLALRMARKAMSSALAWTVYEEVVRRAEAKFLHDAA